MLHSMGRDDSMEGDDRELLRMASAKTPYPIILAGRADNFYHLVVAFEAGTDAVNCGSPFNFGDNNPIRAKAYFKNHGIQINKF